jgi:glycosyltransferase involved in cell wall biosynthesis
VLAPELEGAGVDVITVPSRPLWLTFWEQRPVPLGALKWARWAVTAGVSRRRLMAFLAGRRPDIVHVNCLPHLSGATAARASGYPVVWHIREILPPGARRRFWARRLARNADRIVAVSEATASWMREEGLGDRIEVVYNGIDVPEHVPAPAEARRAVGLPLDGVWVGLIGQLLPHKGTDIFLAAAREAMPVHPELRFLLAGPAPERELRRLKRLVAALPHPERCALLPPQPDGAALIAACDVVCVPTLTPDPLPRVVMEAMAAGRPVIGSRSGGIPELVTEGAGVLVEPGEDLAPAFLQLAADREVREKTGRVARERCATLFSLACHVAGMERSLEDGRREQR